MWSTVEDEDGVYHVVVVDEEGEVEEPHFLSEYCVCHPVIELENGIPIITHNQIH